MDRPGVDQQGRHDRTLVFRRCGQPSRRRRMPLSVRSRERPVRCACSVGVDTEAGLGEQRVDLLERAAVAGHRVSADSIVECDGRIDIRARNRLPAAVAAQRQPGERIGGQVGALGEDQLDRLPDYGIDDRGVDGDDPIGSQPAADHVAEHLGYSPRPRDQLAARVRPPNLLEQADPAVVGDSTKSRGERLASTKTSPQLPRIANIWSTRPSGSRGSWPPRMPSIRPVLTRVFSLWRAPQLRWRTPSCS